MEVLFPEKDPYTDANLRNLAAHAVEGDYANLFSQGSDPSNPIQMTIATASTAVTKAITFARQYAKPPRVFVGVVGAPNINTWQNAYATNVTAKGFTLVANSGAAQTLQVNWESVGQAGG